MPQDENMSTNTAPQETLHTMLVRVEGKLDLVTQRIDAVIPRVEAHEKSISTLVLTTQRLADNAVASAAATAAEWRVRDERVMATAQALAQAKATQEETAANERAKDATSWSPVSRLVAILSAVVSVITVLWALLSSVPV